MMGHGSNDDGHGMPMDMMGPMGMDPNDDGMAMDPMMMMMEWVWTQ